MDSTIADNVFGKLGHLGLTSRQRNDVKRTDLTEMYYLYQSQGHVIAGTYLNRHERYSTATLANTKT